MKNLNIYHIAMNPHSKPSPNPKPNLYALVTNYNSNKTDDDKLGFVHQVDQSTRTNKIVMIQKILL